MCIYVSIGRKLLGLASIKYGYALLIQKTIYCQIIVYLSNISLILISIHEKFL